MNMTLLNLYSNSMKEDKSKKKSIAEKASIKITFEDSVNQVSALMLSSSSTFITRL